nr:protein NETWORKED 2D-like isoform X2 [Erigeron canadensis]
MEDHVAKAMNIVQKDGDSFAKRAEMYYKYRPELIAFIEESVRAYRALAERYDKLSTDLQKANTTIASVFPDQIPYDTDYEDDDHDNNGLKIPKNISPDPPKAPKVPQRKDLKSFLTEGHKKNLPKTERPKHFKKAGLTKEEAVEEIDNLQKDILSMQTVKEFIKSSYENGLANFSEIENKIVKWQQRVCDLQDEFNVVKGIEDDDARVIMAAAALKACEETLSNLQAKHDKSSEDARLENERIQTTKKKLQVIKHKYLLERNNEKQDKVLENNPCNLIVNEQEESQENIKETSDELSEKSWTVTEMADTIDKLVSKVLSLETLVSLQTGTIDRLRIETDDLQSQIQNLEEDKANLIDGKNNLTKGFIEMEKKLDGVQELGMSIHNQIKSLTMQFTETHYNVKHLSENVHNVKSDEEVNLKEYLMNGEEMMLRSSSAECETSTNDRTRTPDQGYPAYDIGDSMSKEHVEDKYIPCMNDNVINEKITKETTKVVVGEKKEDNNTIGNIGEVIVDGDLKSKNLEEEANEDINWQQLLLGGLNDKEKILLQEYTCILRKYKTTKKELAEEEQKNQGVVDEMKLQVQDLKTLLANRDTQIQQMKRKLTLLQKDGSRVEMLADKQEILNDEDDMKSILIDKSEPFSEIEEKLRTNIDALLDENLNFWLRFSCKFHQVQKFKTEVENLLQEIIKVKAKRSEGKSSMQSEINAIYKHIKEIQNELMIWLDQSALLKNELQRRCSSLSNIQEEITTALRDGVEEEKITFSTHQAAKFQGEVLNMQQENSKVNQELEAGLDHIATLQVKTEKTLKRLEEEFGLSDDQKQPRSPHRVHVPLRSFIFGVKSKKQKPSIMACITPHRKLTASDSGIL